MFKTKKIVLVIMLMMLFVFAGCKNNAVEKIEIDYNKKGQTIDLGTFSFDDVKIKKIVGEEITFIKVTPDMVSKKDLHALTTIGKHEITVTYGEEKYTFTVDIVAAEAAPVYEVKNNTDEKGVEISKFKFSSISILKKQAGETTTIPVTESMVSQSDKELLKVVGNHSIAINYEGKKFYVQIKIIANTSTPSVDDPAKPKPGESTVAQLVEIGQKLGDGITTVDKYKVRGKIVSIANIPWGNLTIKQEGSEIFVYGIVDEGGKKFGEWPYVPKVGDVVAVEAHVMKYVSKKGKKIIELKGSTLIEVIKGEHPGGGGSGEGTVVVPDVPAGTQLGEDSAYYSATKGQKGALLKATLREIITSSHKHVTSYGELRSVLPKSDAGVKDSSKILLFYLREEVNPSNTSNWNREHVWPKSKAWYHSSGGGADAHHIRPTNIKENSRRGNSPYGPGSGSYLPNPEVRGDAARIVFYMLTRYAQSDSYQVTVVAQSMKMLLDWHQSDPVDGIETKRNNVLYKIQGNRNPFIDNPDYAYKIWDQSRLKTVSFEEGFVSASILRG